MPFGCICALHYPIHRNTRRNGNTSELEPGFLIPPSDKHQNLSFLDQLTGRSVIECVPHVDEMILACLCQNKHLTRSGHPV